MTRQHGNQKTRTRSESLGLVSEVAGRLLGVLILIGLCLPSSSGCASAQGDGGTGGGDDGGPGISVRFGLTGPGVSLEVVGPEGNGMGATLGIYPVTSLFRKLED